MRISLSTYAPQNDRKLMETRLGAMTQAIESWGYCQASSVGGDPLDVVMSSALGIACASTAPAVIIPFHETVKLLPWQRASSPFQEGSVIFRTPDGRIWPYQSGSSLTSLWFDLIFAQPGAGKSVLDERPQSRNAFCRPAFRSLPFISPFSILVRRRRDLICA